MSNASNVVPMPSRRPAIMARFYSMAVERDLFGRVVLVWRWGRIGTRGKTRLDEHAGEGEALAALVVLKTFKLRSGYQTTPWP